MKYALTSLIVISHLAMFIFVDSSEPMKNQTESLIFYLSTLIPVAIVGAWILGSDNNKPAT
jgi:heme/copper-type cytochrome/quinol oxidase subunit 4